MAQLGFFGDAARVLVDDATGRIEYRPGFLEAATAARWFADLRDGIAWRAERRRMYDRDVDVPRLVASYRLDDAAETVPPELLEAAALCRSAFGAPFNAIGLNRYRDGHDSVAPHNDHLYEIAEGQPIVLLSLGSPRRMTIRSKTRPRRVLDLDLEPGSALVMTYETQKSYDHGVPKTKEPAGERISLALRVRPARA